MPKSCNKEGCNNPVWGKGYCKWHQYLRTDKKPKLIEKKRFDNHRKPTGELVLFQAIWNTRPRESFLSGKEIKEFDVRCFAHVLPKKSYSRYRLYEPNIVLLTPTEHHLFDQGTEKQRQKYAEENSFLWEPLYDLKEKLREEYLTNR